MVHLPNPKRRLAVISFSTSLRSMKQLLSQRNAQVCRTAFAWKSGQWQANVRLEANSSAKRSSRARKRSTRVFDKSEKRGTCQEQVFFYEPGGPAGRRHRHECECVRRGEH